MIQGTAWNEFFNHNDNKTDLLKLLFMYCDKNNSQLNVPVIINDTNETWKLASNSKEFLFTCDHEEADTRLVLHALMDDTNVVIVCKDTDVFILLVYVYSKQKPRNDWFMKMEHNKCSILKR